MDDIVVNLSGHILKMVSQNDLSESLECFWGPVQAEGEIPVVPVAVGNVEGSVELCFGAKANCQ